MGKRRRQKVDIREIVVLVTPILLAFIPIVVMGILLPLPTFIPNFFKVSEVGDVGSVLYPVLICQTLLVLGIVGSVVLALVGSLIWAWKLSDKLGSIAILHIIRIYFVAGLFLWIPFVMMQDEHLMERWNNDLDDYHLYKTEQFSTYQGPLEEMGKTSIEWPYYEDLAQDFIQQWEGILYTSEGEKEINFISGVELLETVDLEEGGEYRVHYLPKTGIIVEIKKLEKSMKEEAIIQKDILSGLKAVEENEKLLGYLNTEYESEANSSYGQIFTNPKLCQVEYKEINLDDDEGTDYVVVFDFPDTDRSKAVLIRSKGDEFRTYLLPSKVTDNRLVVSVVQSKSYGVHDLLVQFRDKSASSLLQYDGEKDYQIREY